MNLSKTIPILNCTFLILFFISVGFLSSVDYDAFGWWMPLSTEELIQESKTIFVGTITGIAPVEVEYQSQMSRNGVVKETVGPETMTLDEYTISVEDFLKNPRDSDTVKVLQATVGGVPGGPARISGFEIGDRALFYLPKDEGRTHFTGQYLPESFNIPGQCDAKQVLGQPRIEGRNSFDMLQDGEIKRDNFTAGKSIQFVYERDMDSLDEKNFNFQLTIRKETDPNKFDEIVLSEKIHAKSNQCEWIASAKVEFIPQMGNYRTWVHITEGTGGSSFSGSFSVDEDIIGKNIVTPPLKQSKSGISMVDVTCKDGLSIGYKKDLSKAICTSPETIYKLERRDWIVSPTHSRSDPSIYENDLAALCNSPDDVLTSYGYSKRDDDIEAKVVSFERIQYDGHAGALLTFDRTFDGGMTRGANNGYFPYIHCINEFVDTFEGCMDVSHHYSDSNYPIVECLTLDGKKFSYDEVEAMSKNSGIEFYTINRLSLDSLEFVGKTDRVDQMISFSVTTPNGDVISAWDELAPDEGEFRVTVTTEGPLGEQQDGTFTITAKQVDVPYYEAFSEFELVGGRIIR